MGKYFGKCTARLGLVLALWAGSMACAAPPAPTPGYALQPWSAHTPVPALDRPDLDGQHWRLDELRGKVVLINFWASWCEPCRAEMPSLQSLGQRHAQDMVVLAVNFKESDSAMASFVQRSGLRLPVLPDAQGALARAWGVRIFPSTVLIDARGRVHGVVRGELDWNGPDAERLLQPLLRTVRPRP